jgi:hypothetical protein
VEQRSFGQQQTFPDTVNKVRDGTQILEGGFDAQFTQESHDNP